MEPDSIAGFTKRALVEMQEREKILSGKKKKRALAARTVYVSLDRADAIIEGGRLLAAGHRRGAAPFGFKGAGFDFSSIFMPIPFFLKIFCIPGSDPHPSNSAH